MDKNSMKVYHFVWLDAHPYRDVEWLCRIIGEGFHIHHMDGDHGNNDPGNLVLIEAGDHFALHGQKNSGGLIKLARKNRAATNFAKECREAMLKDMERGKAVRLAREKLAAAQKRNKEQARLDKLKPSVVVKFNET